MQAAFAVDRYFEHEPVLVYEHEGIAKAFPLSILMYHEIVNDEVNGKLVTATYCPLCNAGIVFDRMLEFNGEDHLLDFGVSGMLRNSDMVMWDRQTESWWQQLTGTALVGELNGAELTMLPSYLISYKEFATQWPEGEILLAPDPEGGYGKNPYVKYDDLENNDPRLYNGEVDDRLPAMERVLDIQVNGEYKIYPISKIQEEGVIQDNFNDLEIVIFHKSGTVSAMDNAQIQHSRDVGSSTIFSSILGDTKLEFKRTESGFKDQNGSVWNITGKCIEGPSKGEQLTPIVHGNHFAFAWFAFHPDCEIY